MPLTLSTLMLIVLPLAVFGIWYEAMAVREYANRVAVDACQRRSLQLLDGTVALSKQRPRLDRTGFRIERTYVFDYAIDGIHRASGFIVMLGHEIQHLGLEKD